MRTSIANLQRAKADGTPGSTGVVRNYFFTTDGIGFPAFPAAQTTVTPYILDGAVNKDSVPNPVEIPITLSGTVVHPDSISFLLQAILGAGTKSGSSAPYSWVMNAIGDAWMLVAEDTASSASAKTYQYSYAKMNSLKFNFKSLALATVDIGMTCKRILQNVANPTVSQPAFTDALRVTNAATVTTVCEFTYNAVTYDLTDYADTFDFAIDRANSAPPPAIGDGILGGMPTEDPVVNFSSTVNATHNRVNPNQPAEALIALAQGSHTSIPNTIADPVEGTCHFKVYGALIATTEYHYLDVTGTAKISMASYDKKSGVGALKFDFLSMPTITVQNEKAAEAVPT